MSDQNAIKNQINAPAVLTSTYNFLTHFEVRGAIYDPSLQPLDLFSCLCSTLTSEKGVKHLRNLIARGIDSYYQQTNDDSFVQRVRDAFHTLKSDRETKTIKSCSSSPSSNGDEAKTTTTKQDDLDDDKTSLVCNKVLEIDVLVCKMFQYLNFDTIKSCKLVCKKWLYKCYDETCFYHLNSCDIVKSSIDTTGHIKHSWKHKNLNQFCRIKSLYWCVFSKYQVLDRVCSSFLTLPKKLEKLTIAHTRQLASSWIVARTGAFWETTGLKPDFNHLRALKFLYLNPTHVQAFISHINAQNVEFLHLEWLVNFNCFDDKKVVSHAYNMMKSVSDSFTKLVRLRLQVCGGFDLLYCVAALPVASQLQILEIDVSAHNDFRKPWKDVKTLQKWDHLYKFENLKELNLLQIDSTCAYMKRVFEVLKIENIESPKSPETSEMGLEEVRICNKSDEQKCEQIASKLEKLVISTNGIVFYANKSLKGARLLQLIDESGLLGSDSLKLVKLGCFDYSKLGCGWEMQMIEDMKKMDRLIVKTNKWLLRDEIRQMNEMSVGKICFDIGFYGRVCDLSVDEWCVSHANQVTHLFKILKKWYHNGVVRCQLGIKFEWYSRNEKTKGFDNIDWGVHKLQLGSEAQERLQMKSVVDASPQLTRRLLARLDPSCRLGQMK